MLIIYFLIFVFYLFLFLFFFLLVFSFFSFEFFYHCNYHYRYLNHYHYLFTVASWKYDKRKLNDAPFVYYCTELISKENEENEINKHINNDNKMKSVYEYAVKVLNALEIKWGPTHLGKQKQLFYLLFFFFLVLYIFLFCLCLFSFLLLSYFIIIYSRSFSIQIYYIRYSFLLIFKSLFFYFVLFSFTFVR